VPLASASPLDLATEGDSQELGKAIIFQIATVNNTE